MPDSLFATTLPGRHTPLPDTVPGQLPARSKTRAALILTLSAVIFSFHMYTAMRGLFSADVQRAVHWSLMAALLFVISTPPENPAGKKLALAWDILCVIAIAAACVYLTAFWDNVSRVNPPSAAELFFGAALILATLEAARRTSGIFLPLTAAVFLAYALVGPYMPGLLKHKGYSLSRLVSYLYSTSSGIYGIPLGVSATYIVLFVFFGTFLNASGAGRLLMECSLALTGRFVGGAAKTAVVASALMGTMSGSPIANAVTTGPITIPLMRESGFSTNVACAVEAVSSTGGMIMPPVMGAAAFLIMEYLNLDYATLMKAAFLPALVFFISIYFTIDFYARKHKIGASARRETHALTTLRQTWHLLVPIVCLIVLLMLRYSPMKSVVWSLIVLFAVSWLRRETRLTPARCLTAITEGAKNSVAVAAACATSGIILGAISLTGVGTAVSSAIFAKFSNFLPGALLASMVVSLILGMGMPATAVYLILATLAAPSLVQLGVHPLAAHMFVFYFGIISTITPPVALTAYAAAAVGGGAPLRVGTKAFVLGIAAYCIPFVLVYAPEMMLIGSIPAALLRFAISIAAVYAVALATVGFLVKKMAPGCRALAALAGLLLITPNLTTDFLGFGLLVLVHVMHYLRRDVCCTEGEEKPS
ncbi:TRAP transporter, 4TM/12TM fusion protein [uncultured delta proteobacterium]|uniref:TRAP transporter, 4TM/12TM fusion protein n=1 Tax=uncultured delta proteobacterium TaxID=34034 RepID=A0A212JUT8_9DELT|nr:TRAP transporter, 4TM/12TM fusion protein [uncultured delta proteobacterium]